ncbi:MAG: proteasome assembly chaperone family protein [Candidatus Micrarchaeia archaeon]
MIEIKMIKDADFKGYTFVEGFPGTGLVGPMAVSYIIDKLELEYAGYLDSADFPPLVSVHNSSPMKPVRIYYSSKYKICTIFAEFAMPVNMIYEVSSEIYKFMKNKGVSKIISIGGIPETTPTKSILSIASTPAMQKLAKMAGLTLINDGVSVGVSAMLISNATLDSIDDLNILVPVAGEIIDPKYAEYAIEAFNKVTKLNIDVSELEREAKEVEAKIREIMKKGKDTHDSYKKVVNNTSPSMYA